MSFNYPKKRFGQNYLRDENIIRKILTEISPQTEDVIIEIGSGEGALTSELIEKTNELIAIEIDKRNVQLLKTKFPELNLIEGDFLKIDLNKICEEHSKKLRIVGNIPYNITSPIIFKMIDNREIVHDAVLMVQQEVAERIIAKPGTRENGILSVITQYFADAKLCFKVSPNVFYPRPKVYSAVIHLTFKENLMNRELDKAFIQIVKAAFGNRRKMLCNSFRNSIFGNLNFENTGIDLKLRAEKLTLEDFKTLAKYVSEQIGKGFLAKSSKH
jgi:16S rRNA (adenine1518-N6/adenine1519-N6)-dimethyltransferase